jgi:hypothetical protein
MSCPMTPRTIHNLQGLLVYPHPPEGSGGPTRWHVEGFQLLSSAPQRVRYRILLRQHS